MHFQHPVRPYWSPKSVVLRTTVSPLPGSHHLDTELWAAPDKGALLSRDIFWSWTTVAAGSLGWANTLCTFSKKLYFLPLPPFHLSRLWTGLSDARRVSRDCPRILRWHFSCWTCFVLFVSLPNTYSIPQYHPPSTALSNNETLMFSVYISLALSAKQQIICLWNW